MVVEKNRLKEIGKKECLDFYNELIKEIKRGKFFTEKEDRRCDESNKKESVFDCPRGLVRLMININSVSVRDCKLKGDMIKTLRIEWFVQVFISRVKLDMRCSSSDQFLEYVQDKIYKESIKPTIEDGFLWSINPSRKTGVLNLKKYKPLKVAKNIEEKIRDMTIVFDGIEGEVIKATKRIDLLISKVIYDEKRHIDKIISSLRPRRIFIYKIPNPAWLKKLLKLD